MATTSPALACSTAQRTASISIGSAAHLLGARPLGHRLAHALLDQGRDLAGLAAAQLDVLADDDDVEVLGARAPQLADVVVAAVAGGGDDADPAALADLGAGRVQAVGVGRRRSRRASAARRRCGSSRRRR